MTNDKSNPKSKIQNAPSFIVGLCITSIATTSLGLVAAAIGVKFGAAPSAGDALRMAWVYVQGMLAFTWLVVWPAWGARRSGASLLGEFAALAMGSVPALAVAAMLSGTTASILCRFALGQIACGLLAMGVLAIAMRHRAVAMVLPVLALAGPVAAFLWFELLRPV